MVVDPKTTASIGVSLDMDALAGAPISPSEGVGSAVAAAAAAAASGAAGAGDTLASLGWISMPGAAVEWVLGPQWGRKWESFCYTGGVFFNMQVLLSSMNMIGTCARVCRGGVCVHCNESAVGVLGTCARARRGGVCVHCSESAVGVIGVQIHQNTRRMCTDNGIQVHAAVSLMYADVCALFWDACSCVCTADPQ